MTEPSEEKTPPGESPAGPLSPPAQPDAAADSMTFLRCCGCAYAEEVNSAAGTLVCKKHNMLINAEADEIPDDCAEHSPKGE